MRADTVKVRALDDLVMLEGTLLYEKREDRTSPPVYHHVQSQSTFSVSNSSRSTAVWVSRKHSISDESSRKWHQKLHGHKQDSVFGFLLPKTAMVQSVT